MTHREDIALSEAEQTALHEFQIAIEYVYRAYGSLLEFHHNLGHAMDRFADAETALRAAGHEAWADELQNEHLPAGVIDDRWSYELVEAFSQTFLSEITAFESAIREELADGLGHVSERQQQREWRERAEGWTPDENGSSQK